MPKLTYFSTFSGIGGFELSIEQAAKKHNIETECVGFSEIDKFCISIYKKHFKEHTPYGNITTIDENELPHFDLLCGGFCCQSHSAIGPRTGLDDPKGQVIFDIIRILRARRPRFIVLENVKGLLSSNKGLAFKRILTELTELGYCCEWQVLNGTHFGSPQARERIIIVGVLGAERAPQILPLDGKTLSKTRFDEARIISYSKGRDAVRVKDTVNTIVASYSGLDGYNSPVVLDNSLLRRFTPLETERLQGFPDNWTEFGENGEKISDSQRYHQCGNAVCVPMLEAVFSELFKSTIYDGSEE